jgi:uncharacterized RDD family membrane protein YckC
MLVGYQIGGGGQRFVVLYFGLTIGNFELMLCPKCESREFDASGICLVCGYAAVPQRSKMAQGEPEPPPPNSPGDLPEWRRELSRRLHEIKLKRDGAAAQTELEPSAGLLFPDSEPQPATVTAFPRPAPRPARKPRAAASAAARAVEMRPVAAEQESEAELPLFAAAEQSRTQAPEPPPPPPSAAHAPEETPHLDPGRILALIDDAIATARGSTRPEPEPPRPAPPAEAPEPDRLILLSRTLSGLIDLLIVFLCATGFVLAAELVSGIVIFDARSALNYALLLLAVHFVYSTFFLKTANQTIGMMITDLRVAGLDGRRPGTRQILVRSASFLLSFLLLGIGLITSLFDTDARCLHDAVSRTRVVRLG